MKALLSVILMVLLFVAAAPAQAWNCPQYSFSFDGDTLSVTNAGSLKLPDQVADVFVNGELVGTFTIDNLLAGETQVLGNVTTPDAPFTWEVSGRANFRAVGTSSGFTLSCVTVFRGVALLDKLRMWRSNERGERIGALLAYRNTYEAGAGWFLVVDANGTQALVYAHAGAAMVTSGVAS